MQLFLVIWAAVHACMAHASLNSSAWSMQLQEYRYRVAFDTSLDTVAYTFHYFQTWDPAASCPGCSMADIHVGVNRQ